MPIYNAAVRTGAPATNVAFAELRAPAGRELYIKEIGVFCAAATAIGVGVARPAAVGVTPTTTFPGYSLGMPRDPGSPAGTGALASAWTTAPTTPTATQGWLRRAMLAAAIGAGIIWTFPEGLDLTIPAAGSIALFNLNTATGGVMDVYLTWEE